MTKRQMFLIAGTIVLAACPGTGLAPCETNDETGDSYCPGRVISAPAETPAQSIDTESDLRQGRKASRRPLW